MSRNRAGCAAAGCDRVAFCKGLCTKHYQRLRRLGTITLQTFEQRFWSYVNKSDGCWIWMGQPGLSGYGRISRNNKVEYAHRIAYELAYGSIDATLTVDHLCRNQMCVNPEHLELSTRSENTRREMAARREFSA